MDGLNEVIDMHSLFCDLILNFSSRIINVTFDKSNAPVPKHTFNQMESIYLCTEITV